MVSLDISNLIRTYTVDFHDNCHVSRAIISSTRSSGDLACLSLLASRQWNNEISFIKSSWLQRPVTANSSGSKSYVNLKNQLKNKLNYNSVSVWLFKNRWAKNMQRTGSSQKRDHSKVEKLKRTFSFWKQPGSIPTETKEVVPSLGFESLIHMCS